MTTPYLPDTGGRGRIKMASASTPSANEPSQGPQFSPHSIAKIKAQISGRMVSSGLSVVAFASVHSEKTRQKKLMVIMIIITRAKTFY